MKPLLLAALLLASFAAAERGVVPVGPRTPPSADDVVWVINGWPIMPGSPECAPRGVGGYVPTEERLRALDSALGTIMAVDLESGTLTTPLTYAEWRMVISLWWPPVFTARPTWVSTTSIPPGYSANCTDPHSGAPAWCGCAAGYATVPPQIDTSDPARTEKLWLWERCNNRLGLLRRADLFDAGYISNATNRAAALCGGWRSQ